MQTRTMLVTLVLSLPPCALAQESEREPHERPPTSEHSLPSGSERPEPTGPVRYQWDAFESIQVNVNAAGGNIPGDAANEPTICASPVKPNRLCIGWRQFDTIASNFREAGYAYSRDGGHTWTFPGVLEEGYFRSDPVLMADQSGKFYYYSLTSQGGQYWCDLFTSVDGGKTWSPKQYGYGGDKQWTAIDMTNGSGKNNFYAAWDYAGCCGDDWFTRSTDGGVSFLTPVPIAQMPYWGTVAVSKTGDVYVIGRDSANDMWVARSTNAKFSGQTPTFTAVPLDLGGTLQYFLGPGTPNPGGLLGQIWIAADHSAGPTSGYLYALSSVNPPGSDPLDVRFSRSTNGGQSWSASIKVNDSPAGANSWQWFGTISVAPNGRIDVVWYDTSESLQPNLCRVRYRTSSDGGVSWSPSQAVSPEFDSWLGWPDQDKLGDYIHMLSDNVGASLAYAATFNGEQDIYFLRIGDYDCNGNGIGDAQDISGGFSKDVNGDAIPDECQCLADLDGDESVGQSDLGILLAAYGTSTGQPGFNAKADIDKNGVVGQSDLGILLAAYGTACP